MALFKSPIEKIWDTFSKLSEDDKAAVKDKLIEPNKDIKAEEQAENPEVETEKTEEVGTETEEISEGETKTEEEAESNTEVVEETEKVEELKPLSQDYEKKFHEYDEMFAALNAKIEAFAKKPIEEEKKPFGKSEGNTEYRAPVVKETSNEMLKRLFGN